MSSSDVGALLDPSLAAELVGLRHDLHSHPELSGNEDKTSKKISDYISSFNPTSLETNIGGNGIAARFEGDPRGATILLRADLDALPIPETIALGWQSKQSGVSHKCGHDGHMAMLAGVAPWLASQKTRKGDIVLLFQPAEETGQGAARVIADPLFSKFNPKWVFALHNLPGFPMGTVISRKGSFAAASRGIVIDLEGRTSHAAEPQKGNSPAAAVASLMTTLGAIPQNLTALGEAAKVTVVHVNLGELAFGTSPGKARIAATLRATNERTMERLSTCCEAQAKALARAFDLKCQIATREPFPATVNDAEATENIIEAAETLGLETHALEEPFPWSEDFGHFTNHYKGALFGLGAGEDTPALHNPEYDFTDELIPFGTAMFIGIIEKIWEKAGRV